MKAAVHKTKAELAAEAIRGAIVDGRFRQGERFNVVHLARELGMSATPVREAMRALQSDGTIEQIPYRRGSIASTTVEDLDEIYRLRLFLEGLATTFATDLMTEEGLAELATLQRAMEECHQRADYAELRLLNYRWHLFIYDFAGTRFIADFIRRLWTSYAWDDVWAEPGTIDVSMQQHIEILEAIRARRGENAGELIRLHIQSGFDRAKRHREAAFGTPLLAVSSAASPTNKGSSRLHRGDSTQRGN